MGERDESRTDRFSAPSGKLVKLQTPEPLPEAFNCRRENAPPGNSREETEKEPEGEEEDNPSNFTAPVE
jgi:hypothetical protein